MANHEACQVYMEQQIEEGLEEGKTPYAIGKEISTWMEKLFEAKIPHRTIEQRARRINATNVAKQSITQPESKSKPEPVDEPTRDDRYQEAMKTIKKVILDAKRDKYGSTSKESILEDIEVLRNIIAPPKKPTKRQKDLQEEFWNDDIIANRAAFHSKNSKSVQQMRGSDELMTIEKIVPTDNGLRGVRVFVRNVRGKPWTGR